MADPTAEVICSVEMRVKFTDTGINESKEIILNEYVEAIPMKWQETFKHAARRVTDEMSGMVEALEIERFKAE
jgi:hypothetical protein